MKNKLLLITGIATIMMSFSQCNNEQFDKKAPSTITDIFYQDWVGGRPGVRGKLVTIKMKSPKNNMVFDSIFFNNKVIKLNSSTIGDILTLTGNFVENTYQNRDIIMSSNPKEEFGNKPTTKIAKIPFELSDNEAVISYIIKDKKRYYIVKNIKKGKAIYYQ